jgi:hypothetical protein
MKKINSKRVSHKDVVFTGQRKTVTASTLYIDHLGYSLRKGIVKATPNRGASEMTGPVVSPLPQMDRKEIPIVEASWIGGSRNRERQRHQG